MLPLISALLLAVWIIHPWNAIDTSPSGHGPTAPALTRESAPEERAFVLERGAAARIVVTPSPTPSPTPAPTASPAPAPPPTPAPPPPQPVVTPAPGSPLSAEQIQALVCSYAWPCDEALRVMWCESGGRPSAIGRGANYGLFQMNQVHARRIPEFWTSWMDPVKNIEWAYQLWLRQGWRPWGCKP
jgi:hypothetical protein